LLQYCLSNVPFVLETSNGISLLAVCNNPNLLQDGYDFYPEAFDVTKVWSHKLFPLIEVGELELNRNVTNYFCEVEQACFSPNNLVPGISFSPDKNLQGRLVAYTDTQLYRVGANFSHLPINCPHVKERSYHEGGNMNYKIENKYPNWEPNSFRGPKADAYFENPSMKTTGDAFRYSQNLGEDWDYYKQPGDLFRLMSQEQKEHLTDNIATSLETVPANIINRMLPHFYKADPLYGEMVERNLNIRKQNKMPRTESEMLLEKVQTILRTFEVRSSTA